MLLVMRYILISVIFVLTTFFILPTIGNAQVVSDYRFLEVFDTEGKPVADANVSLLPNSDKLDPNFVEKSGREVDKITGEQFDYKTDENGHVSHLFFHANEKTFKGSINGHVTQFYYPDYNSMFKISKSGFITYFGVTRSYESLLTNSVSGSVIEAVGTHIEAELLKLPANEDERKVLEVRQMKREFILAVKIGDIDSVKKMLKAGANANITDEKGIPAILFAGANGNKEMIELLLSANADIKSKNQLGRRILLYYLHFSYPHSLISTELIQKLIQAGADVNAMDSRGITVLNLAATYNDKATINLLKRAGARKLNKTNAR